MDRPGYFSLLLGIAKKKQMAHGAELADKFSRMGRAYRYLSTKGANLHADILKAKVDYDSVVDKTRAARAYTALGAGAGVGGIYYSRNKNKKATQAQLSEASQLGQKALINSMLQDPKFPLDSKLSILEGTGAIKLSSKKTLFSILLGR